MFKYLMIANSLLTLPFALGALIMPAKIFADFGLTLDSGGELVARGYAATLVGYGLSTWFLRGIDAGAMAGRLLVASGLFNAIEFAIQFIAAQQGVPNGRIWLTVGAHGVMVLLTGFALIKNGRSRA